MEKERVEEEEKGLGEGELVGEDCVKAVGFQDRSHKEEDGLRSDGLTPSDSDEASKPADDTGSPSPDNTSSTGENGTYVRVKYGKVGSNWINREALIWWALI